MADTPLDDPGPDLMALLRGPVLARLALGSLLGGALGFGVGVVLLPHAEARAVMRVGTLGRLGPVVPMSEVKARLESRMLVRQALTTGGLAEVDGARYRLQADVDSTGEGSIVVMSASGPDEHAVEVIAQHALRSQLAFTHEAWVAATALEQARFERATQVEAGMRAAGAPAEGGGGGGGGGGHAAAALLYERWAGELAALRSEGRRVVLESRDSEVIDEPYVTRSRTRAVLLGAVGALAVLSLLLTLQVRRPAS